MANESRATRLAQLVGSEVYWMLPEIGRVHLSWSFSLRVMLDGARSITLRGAQSFSWVEHRRRDGRCGEVVVTRKISLVMKDTDDGVVCIEGSIPCRGAGDRRQSLPLPSIFPQVFFGTSLPSYGDRNLYEMVTRLASCVALEDRWIRGCILSIFELWCMGN